MYGLLFDYQTEKTREVFEENLLLREKVHQGELELRRLRGLCDDFNNLSARVSGKDQSFYMSISDLTNDLSAVVFFLVLSISIHSSSNRVSRKEQAQSWLRSDIAWRTTRY